MQVDITGHKFLCDSRNTAVHIDSALDESVLSHEAIVAVPMDYVT